MSKDNENWVKIHGSPRLYFREGIDQIIEMPVVHLKSGKRYLWDEFKKTLYRIESIADDVVIE